MESEYGKLYRFIIYVTPDYRHNEPQERLCQFGINPGFPRLLKDMRGVILEDEKIAGPHNFIFNFVMERTELVKVL